MHKKTLQPQPKLCIVRFLVLINLTILFKRLVTFLSLM